MGELIGREKFPCRSHQKRQDQKGTVLVIELRSPDLAPCDWDEIRVLAHLSRRANIVGNNHKFPMQDSFQLCLYKFYGTVLVKRCFGIARLKAIPVAGPIRYTRGKIGWWFSLRYNLLFDDCLQSKLNLCLLRASCRAGVEAGWSR